MKSIIRQFYFGECGQSENIEPSEEYWEVNKEYAEIYEELEKGLTEKQKEMLEQLYVASGGLESESGFTHFKEGFKLGLLIANEVFN